MSEWSEQSGIVGSPAVPLILFTTSTINTMTTTAMTWEKHRAIGDFRPPTTECYPYTITTYPRKRYVLTLSPSERVLGQYDKIGKAKDAAEKHKNFSVGR